MADAPEEVRRALIGDIAHALDLAMYHANGKANGYGLGASDLAELREALEGIVDGLARTSVKLVRPEVLESIRREQRERETAEKVNTAWRDTEYVLGFRASLIAPTNRTGWKGNKKQRAEVEALYKADPKAGSTA